MTLSPRQARALKPLLDAHNAGVEAARREYALFPITTQYAAAACATNGCDRHTLGRRRYCRACEARQAESVTDRRVGLVRTDGTRPTLDDQQPPEETTT
jgi:hypothetical protein